MIRRTHNFMASRKSAWVSWYFQARNELWFQSSFSEVQMDYRAISLPILSLALCLYAQPSWSHDYQPEDDTPTPLPISAFETNLSSVTDDAISIETAKSVVNAFKLWEPGQELSFCFFGGDSEVRRFFIEVSRAWDDVTSLTFYYKDGTSTNCSETSEFDIRVSFDPSKSSYSYVGRDAEEIGQNSPTLNIKMTNSFAITNKRRLQGTILHEIGHAIAFEHEHQSPDSKCSDYFDWTSIYSELSKPPNNMSTADVDRNIRPIAQSERLRYTSYDTRSIMHYSFPARWYIPGTPPSCIVEKNLALSSADKALAEAMYPATPQAQDDYLIARAENLGEFIEELSLPDEVRKLIDGELRRIMETVDGRSPTIVAPINSTTGPCSSITTGGTSTTNCTFGTNP
jgi:serralysin